jgi:hypothetical protein
MSYRQQKMTGRPNTLIEEYQQGLRLPGLDQPHDLFFMSYFLRPADFN